ncbi:MAG: hypothetical protein SWJ54_20805, partial [Cyanobacteriota bacterium]|nr:hypothetical protein [Cyanobacteriota bacterium]
GLFAQTNPEATGNAGTLTVETQRLTVRDGAQISVSTQSPGNGGIMLINASESVEILDGVFREDGSRVTSGLFSSVGRLNDPDINPQATGEGGDIILETQRLLVRNSQLTASTFAIGDGGTLTLNVGELVIQDGGEVGVGSFGEGQGGELNVNAAESITIFGTGLGFTLSGETELRPVNSRLFAQSESSGNAGNIQVTTGDLIIRDQGEITTSSLDSGNAGNLNITARSLSMSNTGQISSSSEGSGSAGNLNITIRDDIHLDRASITANTVAGEGNIRLRSPDLRLRNHSNITTNATGVAPGGNIEIDTRQLVALENSDISANAEQAEGGRVTINADAVFGIRFRQQPSDASDITATSQLGAEFSGTVQLNSEIDTSQGLIELSRDIIDPAALIAQTLCQQGEDSELIITGRGGLPPNPTQGTRQRGVSLSLTEPIQPDSKTQSHSNRQRPRNRNLDQNVQPLSSDEIVPARGWIRTEKGEIILVSYDPTRTQPQRQLDNSRDCSNP